MAIQNNFPAIRPTLLLDFANTGRLDSRITFTRASSATFFDQLGVLQTAASGAARFTYNPATLQPQGLLIEEQRTNSIRNNTMQGAVAGTPGTNPTNWDITVSPSGIVKEIVGTGVEDGITYIDVRYSGTGSGSPTPQIRPETTTQIVAAAGQTWTASYYLRIVGGSTTGLLAFSQVWQERDAAGAALNTVVVNISTPTTAALKTQSSILTRTLTEAGTARLTNRIQFTCANGVAVDVTLRIGLPQLEQGAFATSVIPTTTTALTRNADVASMTGTNFSSWYNQSEGTIVWDAQTAQGTSAYPWSLFGSNTQNRIYANYATNARIESGVRVDGTFVANNPTPNNSAPTNTFGKGATAYKADDFGFSWNGAAALTDTTLTLPTVQQLDIGNNGALSANFLNGTIRRIAYYPQRLPNAQLQALTG